MPDRPSVWSGTLTVAFAAALFGTSGLFVHALRDFPFVTLLAYRFGLAALAFALLAAYRWRAGKPWQPKRHLALHYVGLGVGLVAITALFFKSILEVGMGLATLLLATAPAWVVVANWAFWSMRPRLRVLAGIGVGVVGVALVIPWDGTGHATTIGVLSGIGAGLAHAAWMLVSRDAGLKGAWGETQAGMSALVGALLLMPIAAVVAPRVPSPAEVVPLLGLALVTGALAIVLLSRGLRSVDAARAGVLMYAEPVTALALGVIALGEAFTLTQGAGAVLVITGMVIVTLNRRRVRRGRARDAITQLPERPARRRGASGDPRAPDASRDERAPPRESTRSP